MTNFLSRSSRLISRAFIAPRRLPRLTRPSRLVSRAFIAGVLLLGLAAQAQAQNAPVIDPADAAVNHAENTPITTAVETYTDTDGDTVTWTWAAMMGGLFAIDADGALTFKLCRTLRQRPMPMAATIMKSPSSPPTTVIQTSATRWMLPSPSPMRMRRAWSPSTAATRH